MYGGAKNKKLLNGRLEAVRNLKMVGVAELESATPCVSCKCSNQLSYTPLCQGVDLNHRPKAYESSALPLSYPGLVVKVGYFPILPQICQAFFKKYLFVFKFRQHCFPYKKEKFMPY